MKNKIIEADRDSIESWLKMRKQLWPLSNDGDHLKEMEEILHLENSFAWIVFQDGNAVAFAEVCIRPFANGCENRPVPFLEGIWVDPSLRKQGVGKYLVDFISRWCSQKGYFELGSDSEITNVDSIMAHERWGFEETERVVYFRIKLKDVAGNFD